MLYFVTGISESNKESNSKYPVLPNWGFIHDFTELLAGEVAGAGEARGVGGGGGLYDSLDWLGFLDGKACIRGSLGGGGVMVGSCGKKGLV